MKINKVTKGINIIFTVITFLLLTIASVKFISYNSNIIKNIPVFAGVTGIALCFILVSGIKELKKSSLLTMTLVQKVITLLLTVSVIAVIVVAFIQSAVVDYFQPFSLYDDVIYLSIVGFVLIIIRTFMSSISAFLTSNYNKNTVLLMVGAMLLIVTLGSWNMIQGDFEYNNITDKAYHVFEAGESDYDIFRIPTILVIPNKSELADGTVLTDDTVIVMAEARKNGSSDHGDIDLVQKRSTDGGDTWSELEVVRRWEDGIGKIGNSTPVFDQVTGEINLLHIAGEKPADYKTYSMESSDGGISWNEPRFITEGIVGPGHGIQIDSGDHEGRLVIPGYKDGGSYAIYSDDHGQTWLASEQFDDGNECEITQVNDQGKLMITVRTIHPVSEPHEKFHKLFAFSDDGGVTWSELKENQAIKEPVCMSSVVRGDGIYYSYPNDYYSRSNMTIAKSIDEGVTFENILNVYDGPAGYSDLGITADNELLLVFENGAVEYDERITFLKIKNQ